ncbi:adult-specific cuticular protein ACP-20-like [Uranotaenia lowii]|uniref:adult-specific cuticular protein ACP-20-like n=1 Tax=Uranotaenia lowii TaxID=190385 RepID=UPI00247983AB|nr:adult-specific cuticular protein ACP-20-like [Uranotaenia lowii]
MFKLTVVAIFGLLAVVSSQHWGGNGGDWGGYGSGYGAGGYHHDQHDHHAYPKYNFEYGVKDHHTGDHKSQWEQRDGDVVKGGYTLDEADGTKRIVEYYSDGHHGLQAHVKRVGHAVHPQVYGHHNHHGGFYGNAAGAGYGYGGHGHGTGYSYNNLDQHF